MAVAAEGIAERHGIDGHGVAGTANPLTGKPHDTLHQRHAATDIAAVDHEVGEKVELVSKVDVELLDSVKFGVERVDALCEPRYGVRGSYRRDLLDMVAVSLDPDLWRPCVF